MDIEEATRRAKQYRIGFLTCLPISGLLFLVQAYDFGALEPYAVLSSLMVVFLVVPFALWIAALIAKQAVAKGRSWGTFFALSLLFPLITWIITAVMSTDQLTVVAGTKKCTKCAEVVKEEAILCKHCGSGI